MPTKYRRGKRIDSVDRLLELLKDGKWVYMENRPKAPQFIINLPLKKLQEMIDMGYFYEAELRKANEGNNGQHQFPIPHTPHWLLDNQNQVVGHCQFPGCLETRGKSLPTPEQLDNKLSKQRNYKHKLEEGEKR